MMEQRSLKGIGLSVRPPFIHPPIRSLSPLYGARHRAALGISEITDSFTVVVSEETGTISFATDGKFRKIPRKELRACLVNELDWFNTQEKGGEYDVKKRKSKIINKKRFDY